jgi:hypothetical protein
MDDGEEVGFAIFPMLHLRAFQSREEERPKVPHIKQGLALTDFDHDTHHARINDILAQDRYSPKEGSTCLPTFSLIPTELEALDPNPGPEVGSLQALAQEDLDHRTKYWEPTTPWCFTIVSPSRAASSQFLPISV